LDLLPPQTNIPAVVQTLAAPVRGVGAPALARAPQGGEQAPAEQARSARQSLPHWPQLFLSVSGETQAPPQAMSGALQPTTHEPPEQMVPAAQSPSSQQARQVCWPQHLVEAGQPWCEQDIPSGAQVSVVQLCPSEQSPASQHTLHASPQSLGVAVLQWHVEPTQLAPGLHEAPHAPQFIALLVVSVSHPGAPVQSPNPPSHTGLPASQCW
jgi:hypothetical protein